MANPALNKQFGELPAVGTSAKTGFLLTLVLGAGAWGWKLVDPASGQAEIPVWWFFAAIGAFGLMVTIVWTYIEILRLLGKLRS